MPVRSRPPSAMRAVGGGIGVPATRVLMVDTDRFQLGPQIVHTVGRVAVELAERGDGRVSPLQVATHVPLDVDSVARTLESMEGDYDVERVQSDGICLFRFADPGDIYGSRIDLESGEHLEPSDSFEENLAALKAEEGWERKVREQHELLSIAAESGERTVELAYFLSRTDVASARVQSILNDFGAEGYVDPDLDEEADLVEYTFPAFDYPDERLERNMSFVAEVDESTEPTRVWSVVGAIALLLLVIVVMIRFYV